MHPAASSHPQGKRCPAQRQAASDHPPHPTLRSLVCSVCRGLPSPPLLLAPRLALAPGRLRQISAYAAAAYRVNAIVNLQLSPAHRGLLRPAARRRRPQHPNPAPSQQHSQSHTDAHGHLSNGNGSRQKVYTEKRLRDEEHTIVRPPSPSPSLAPRSVRSVHAQLMYHDAA